MAKKKSSTDEGTIRCNDYLLNIHNGPESFTLDLVVRGSDGKQHTLQVDTINDRTELIQRVLRKLADLWPAFDWSFKAEGNTITEV